jgi:hypothetical protein
MTTVGNVLSNISQGFRPVEPTENELAIGDAMNYKRRRRFLTRTGFQESKLLYRYTRSSLEIRALP